MARARTPKKPSPPSLDEGPRKPWTPESKWVMLKHESAFDALLVVANLEVDEDLPTDPAPAFTKGIKFCRAQGFLDGLRITDKGREAYKRARLEDLPAQKLRPDLTHRWAWQMGPGTKECKACGLAVKFQRGTGKQLYLVEGTWIETCPVCPMSLPLSPEHVSLLRLIQGWTDAPGTAAILGKEDRIRLIHLRQRGLVLPPQHGARAPQIAPAGRAYLAMGARPAVTPDEAPSRKRLHRGLRTHRLADNPEERLFAEAWEKSNRQGNTLDHLLDDRVIQGGEVPEAGDRDRTVAATVVQWLGSNVGRGFLADLGYTKRTT